MANHEVYFRNRAGTSYGDVRIIENVSDFVREIMGEKRKVAILTPVYSKYVGVSRLVEYIAKDLSKNGYDVTILTLEYDMSAPENVNIKVMRAPKDTFFNRVYRILFLLDIRAIVWALRLKKFDLIITPQHPMTYLAYLSKKLYKVKFVYWNQDFPTFQDASKFSRNLIEKIYQKLWDIYNFLIKNADYIVSNSKFSGETLFKKMGLKSVVIYPKIDTDRFKTNINGRIIRDKYNASNDLLILFVGRISPSKGIHLLVKAFKLVKQKIPEAKLIIVGNPYYTSYLEDLKKMCDKSVIFAGYVPDEELPYYYAACDVYATCTLLEGYNLPLAEAQACGKPVVAFDIGPHKEVVKNGILVKEGDIKAFAEALIKLLQESRKL